MAKEISMYIFVIMISGYCTKKLIDYMVDPSASKVYDEKFQKKMQVGKRFVGEGVYKSTDDIESEFL